MPIKKLVQDLLDHSGRALLNNDFAQFTTSFHLPFESETFDGKQELGTTEQLRNLFDQGRACFLRMGVTEMMRTVVEAELKTPACIVSTHVTRFANHMQLAPYSFPVFCVIKKIDGHWGVTRSEFAIADAPDLSRLLAGRTLLEA